MESTVFTPRLRLTLITEAERRSPEFEWLHKIYSDEKATWWSISGRAKSFEDTEKLNSLSFVPTGEGETKSWRVVYAVHTLQASKAAEAEFIGLVKLRSLNAGYTLPLPEHLTIPASSVSTTLTLETAYMFLPDTWGKGYATEAVTAVFEAAKCRRNFWKPFEKVYIRAIVNSGNPASQRVMAKAGMELKGIYEWTCEPGKPIFLAGEWKERDDLFIYGVHLLE